VVTQKTGRNQQQKKESEIKHETVQQKSVGEGLHGRSVERVKVSKNGKKSIKNGGKKKKIQRQSG